MSYEVLARKWRPATFDDVYGQKHVTTTLANAIRSGRLPHAVLLCGPRGIGKTTIARILARSLNCDEGPTPKPCGNCDPCREIAAGTSLDVQEIDAASNTGVDNVRDIRESIRYSAAPEKHRIFIIDEVHMLSTPAFNALLKTLEEPPPRSLFVFATTDPQKIPATVLSRVQRFDLKRLPASDIYARLREIVEAEGVEVSESVLRAVVREADGSMRDSQTLLDRLIAGIGTTVSDEEAAAVLDLIDRRLVWRILDPILDQDAAAALGGVREALEKGIDPARLAAELLTGIRNLIVAALVEEPGPLLDAVPDELDEIRGRARKQDAEALQRLFRVLVTRLQELSWAPVAAHVVEMAVVRLATLPDTEAISRLVERIDALGSGGGAGPGPRGGGAGPGGGRGPSGGQRPTAGSPEPGGGSSEPRGQRAPGRSPAPAKAERPDRRLRQEAKTHPVVQDVIEVLDAELTHIRIPDPAAAVEQPE